MKKKGSVAIENLKYKMLMVSMVNILVVSSMLGIQGAGYFGISLALLVVCTSLHSAWLSALVSKYVRGRNVRSQYRSSEKILRGALIYALLSGIIWTTLLILFGNKLGEILVKDVHIGFCFMLIGPVLLTYGLEEALSGYFRGAGMYQPVIISMCIRQASFFAGSIFGLKAMSGYGEKIAGLLHNEAITCVYGAFGALIGLFAGNLIGLIVLAVFRGLLHGEFRRLQDQDNARYRETTFHGFRAILGAGFFQGIRWLLLTAALPVNYVLYVRLCKTDVDSTAWIKTGGFLFGTAVPVMLILVLGFAAFNNRNYRQLVQNLKSEAYGQFQEKFSAILLSVFALLLPVCGAAAVLAGPVLKLILKSTAKEGSSLIAFACAAAVLMTLEIIAVKLMQMRNETIYSLLALLAGFAAQTVLMAVLFKTTDIGTNGLFIGVIFETVIVTVLFFMKYRRRLRFSAYFIKKSVMIGILALSCVLIMLLIDSFAGKNLPALTALLVSAVPGFLLYFGVIAFMPLISRGEAEAMPGGGLILQLKRLLRRE